MILIDLSYQEFEVEKSYNIQWLSCNMQNGELLL